MNREGKRRSGCVPSPYSFVLALRKEHSRSFVFLKAMQALCHLFNGIEVVSSNASITAQTVLYSVNNKIECYAKMRIS